MGVVGLGETGSESCSDWTVMLLADIFASRVARAKVLRRVCAACEDDKSKHRF